MFFPRSSCDTYPIVVLVVIIRCFCFNNGLVGVPMSGAWLAHTKEVPSLADACRPRPIFQDLVGGVGWSIEVVCRREVYGAGECSTRAVTVAQTLLFWPNFCLVFLLFLFCQSLSMNLQLLLVFFLGLISSD